MHPPQKIQAFVVSHSHWDRAWYLSFEAYRHRLIRMTDRILSLLSTNPEYASFMFDGQTILLEDYLTIRPEQRSTIKTLIEHERLVIGPWYILPDMFLVSGESLIRNLQCGQEDGKQWGGLLKVGYVPDPFGHIAQLPQLLQQMGLDTFLFMRGMPEQEFDRLGTLFEWKAPDGSRVTASYMMDGYFNASALGYPSIYGRFEGLTPDTELASKRVTETIDHILSHQKVPGLVLFNGMDHMPEQAELPTLLHELRSLHPEIHFTHTSLNAYADWLRAQIKGGEVYQGDLDGNAHHPILKSVWSTRVYLKQANHRLESLLSGVLEPLWALMADRAAVPFDSDLHSYLWRTLLKNHPHDDICGCSLDEVHLDNEARFHQVEALAESLITEMMEAYLVQGFSHPVQARSSTFEPSYLWVTNPHPYPIEQWVEAELFFPNPDGETGTPPPPGTLQAIDHEGSPLELEVLNTEAPVMRNQFLGGLWGRRYRIRVKVAFRSSGYKIIGCLLEEVAQAPAPLNTPSRVENLPWAKAVLEWSSDLGDTYSYGPDPSLEALYVQAVRYSSNQLQWKLTHPRGDYPDMTVAATIEALAETGTALHLSYTNHWPNGRLRLLLPMESGDGAMLADHAFRLAATQAQSTQTPESNPERWNSYPGELGYGVHFMRDGIILPEEKHRWSWLATRGLHEYEWVNPQHLGSCVALTLHRSVGMLSVGGGRIRRVQAGPSIATPGAQCLRPLQMSIATGQATSKQEALRNLKAFAHPLQARLMPQLPYCTGKGYLPALQTTLQIDHPAMVLSALRPSSTRGETILRFYSISDQIETVTLKLWKTDGRYCFTDLREEWDEPASIAFSDGTMVLDVDPHKIVTLLIR